MPTLPPKNTIYYFCDESSQTNDAWMAVGGLAVSKDAVPQIARDLAEIKNNSPKTGELKWENAKSYGGMVHRSYVDYLFNLVDKGRAHFHIRFSPMAEYDHNESGPRKRIDTVSKAFYQLLLHRALKFYGEPCALHIYPDNGECTSMLPKFRHQLISDACRKFGKGQSNHSIDLIECRDSATEPLLQLLDIPLGALAAMKNGRHMSPEISETKRELSKYVLEKAGWKNLSVSNLGSHRPLNKWIVEPSYKRGQQR